MLFVSAPSLAISFILAVFYAANLVFYVMNKERDTDNFVEIATVSCENEPRQQQTVLLTVLQDTSDSLKQLRDDDFSQFSIFNFQFSIFNYFCGALPDVTSILDSGICWKLFSRPPPVS